MPLPTTSPAAYHWFRTEMRCIPRTHIAFYRIPRTSGDDKPPTPEKLVKDVRETLAEYHRETRDYLPLLGVLAPRRNSNWPHVHLLLQHPRETAPGSPIVSAPALITAGEHHDIKVVPRFHLPREDDERETDVIFYVCAHLDRIRDGLFRPEILMYGDPRTHFDKDRSAKELKRKRKEK